MLDTSQNPTFFFYITITCIVFLNGEYKVKDQIFIWTILKQDFKWQNLSA
jgi:hypothetical protein